MTGPNFICSKIFRKKALALCLGLPVTASRVAKEVPAVVVPLDLGLYETATRNAT